MQGREIFDAVQLGDQERTARAARDHIAFVQRSYIEEQSRAQQDQISGRRLALM